MPSSQSSPSAAGSDACEEAAATTRSGRSAAHASACGPPPEPPSTAKRWIPSASAIAAMSPRRRRRAAGLGSSRHSPAGRSRKAGSRVTPRPRRARARGAASRGSRGSRRRGPLGIAGLEHRKRPPVDVDPMLADQLSSVEGRLVLGEPARDWLAGEDAEQAPVLRDGQSLQVELGHQMKRFVERHVGRDGDDVGVGDVPRSRGAHVGSPRDRGDDALDGDAADAVVAVGDEHARDMRMREQLGGLARARVAWSTRGSATSASRTITDRCRAPRAPPRPRGCW